MCNPQSKPLLGHFRVHILTHQYFLVSSVKCAILAARLRGNLVSSLVKARHVTFVSSADYEGPAMFHFNDNIIKAELNQHTHKALMNTANDPPDTG